ncbi:hypothetical protein D9619_002130 [Psilocybe cf. subviscida]|uniref:C2H2-type domain-containing protein n=1 Tax=Psilocybe cf. subviscida TaxID=2480587 RepID=A0A8H5BEZ5_9AGAR|nr:hypothetical protein D9619_002130 [Psilocybe cf. subviscida]
MSVVDSSPAFGGSPVDNVRRDIKDGAYHCPQCDTPFTRRSNLRRHFQIHMRSATLKCENCNEEFAAKEDLQSHTPNCYSWSAMQGHGAEKAYGGGNTHGRQMSQQPQAYDARNHGSYAPTAFPSFDSPETRYLGSYHTGGTGDFGIGSMGGIPMSPGSSVPPTPPLTSSYDGNNYMTSNATGVYPHRRQSVSSSSNSSSSASSSPYTQPPAHVQAANYGYFNGTDTNALFNNSQGQTRLGSEKLYTRRQVKDMIDVVSECLIESMENVLRPPTIAGTIQLDSPDGQMIRPVAGRDETFRQTLLSDAIPRAYLRMHSGANNPKV